MRKMIITMLLASTPILTLTSTASANDVVNNDSITIIDNIQTRVKTDEFGINHLIVEKDDVIKDMSIFLDVNTSLLEEIEDKLELSLFEEDDKISYISNKEDKVDAILIEKSSLEDNDENKYIYIDFKSEDKMDLCKIIDLDEYNSILNSWKLVFPTDEVLIGAELTKEEVESYKNISPIEKVEWPINDSEVIVIEDKTPTTNPDSNEGTESNSNDQTEENQIPEETSIENVEQPEETGGVVYQPEAEEDFVVDNPESGISENVPEIEETEVVVATDEVVEIPEVEETESEVIETDEEVQNLEDINVDDIIETTEEVVESEGLPYEEEVEIIEEVAPEEVVDSEDLPYEEEVEIIEEVVLEEVEETNPLQDEKDYASIAANNPQNAGLQPHVARFKEEVADKYGVNSFSLYRPGDPQDHGKGLAVDFMVPVGSDQGDNISEYSINQMNSGAEQISYVIWEQRIYGDWTSEEGQYMEDRGSITENHFDHVHVSFY